MRKTVISRRAMLGAGACALAAAPTIAEIATPNATRCTRRFGRYELSAPEQQESHAMPIFVGLHETLFQQHFTNSFADGIPAIVPVPLGNPGDVESVGSGVSELRIDYGPGYRVYYARTGRIVYLLLCGGTKATQDADIKRAIDMNAARAREVSAARRKPKKRK